jgi:glycerol-3-phosphate acyltransferase PlsY
VEIAVRFVAAAVVAYLMGAMPWAVIVVRLFWKQDIRTLGSGNSGATNVLRVFGVPPALAVAVLDVAKGALGVWLAMLIAPADASLDMRDWFGVVGALAAVTGHSYSPFIGFRGGKGVATSAGALMVLAPWVWPPLLLAFVVLVAAVKIVSVASMTLALLLPLACWLIYPERHILLLFGVLTSAVVLWRHRSNMKRLAHGEEPKITFKRRLWDDMKSRTNDRGE